MPKKGNTLLKKIILIDVVVVIYILLASSIINYQSEKKVWAVIVDSVIEWRDREYGYYKETIDREIGLSAPKDLELTNKLKGKILLQVESKGEAWYLNPEDSKRYYFGKKNNTWRTIRKFAVKLSEDEIFNYVHFEKAFPELLAGRFVMDEKKSDEIFYVDTVTRQGLKLSSVKQAWQVINEIGLGVTNINIRKIEVGVLN